MNELLQRLKERKMVQWVLAYVAAAFALLQGIDIVAQRFGWPEQTMRFVIIALSVGLFVALVLAWYHGERGAQRVTGTELLILALLLAIVATPALAQQRPPIRPLGAVSAKAFACWRKRRMGAGPISGRFGSGSSMPHAAARKTSISPA